MFFRPRYLSILTTRQYTAACDHCCIGSSPQQRQAIPVQRIHELIDEATRIESIELMLFALCLFLFVVPSDRYSGIDAALRRVWLARRR